MKKDNKPIVTVTAKDVVWSFYNPPGNGGQAKNKTMNGARCKHVPSGAMATDHSTRSLLDNKKKAFEKMGNTKEFQSWIKLESYKKLGLEEKIKAKVDHEVNNNTRVEVLIDGKWINENDLPKVDSKG